MARPAPITDADRTRIAAAVTAAEARSAGEIVTIITERSDTYADITLIWSAVAAFLALTALALAPTFYLGFYDRLTGGWVQQWQPREVFAVALLVAIVKFAGMWLLQLWSPLKFLLVPGPVKHHRARARAVTCFKVGADSRTQGGTGILLYLSMRERRAEIVTDAAISAKVAPEVWGEAMAAMIAHIADGRVADGMIAAIEQAGAVLAEHFPHAAGDVNELPDRLIEV